MCLVKDGVEDGEHTLFPCPSLDTQKRDRIAVSIVRHPFSQFETFGDSITYNDIFNVVSKALLKVLVIFIHKTNQFD